MISSLATANTTPIKMITNDNPSQVAAYWTPERMRDATPMELPKADKNRTVKMQITDMMQKFSDQEPKHIDGAPPRVTMQPNNQPLFQPRLQKRYAALLDAGTLKEPFSSSQLTPLNADQAYPYSTVGKLFFTTPTGNKTCTAAVIGNRLVLTAGHCLHNGNGSSSGYYGNWMFIPAYHSGTAPFATWHFSNAVLTNAWYTSGGVVPNAGDYAIIAFADQPINGTTVSLGHVVGKLGFQTLSTIPNHAHLFGYPGNLDNGQIIHQVTAQSAQAVAPSNAEYGSDMNLGSGGGPWIQNFGIASQGQTGGTNTGRNLVIGLSSYGYNDSTTLAEGSPILDATFANVYNYMCTLATGNC